MRKSAAVVVTLVMVGALVPAAAAQAGELEVPTVIEVVVRTEDSDPAALVGLARDHGGWLVEPLVGSRNVYLIGSTVLVKESKVDEEAAKRAEEWAKDLAKDDRVRWAEPQWRESAEDSRFHAWPDADYEEVDGADLTHQHAFAGLDLDAAHQVATGAGAVVAVLDTGIDPSHPLLAGRLIPGYDLVDDDPDAIDEGNGWDDDGDGRIDEAYGHGTFVAGVVAQIAPGAAIAPIRVLDADGRAQLYAVVEGIDMALEMGADVINLSFSLPDNRKPAPLKAALKRAKEADVIVIGAAGNRGDDHKLYPASEGSVISVAALDVDHPDEVAGFSGHGKWVRLAAPGVDVVSAVPGGGYARWAGTSMAAPVVAGQAALLVEIDPAAKFDDVKKALKDSAHKMEGKSRADSGAIDILDSIDKIS